MMKAGQLGGGTWLVCTKLSQMLLEMKNYLLGLLKYSTGMHFSSLVICLTNMQVHKTYGLKSIERPCFE